MAFAWQNALGDAEANMQEFTCPAAVSMMDFLGSMVLTQAVQ